jgi:hypothetical protein
MRVRQSVEISSVSRTVDANGAPVPVTHPLLGMGAGVVSKAEDHTGLPGQVEITWDEPTNSRLVAAGGTGTTTEYVVDLNVLGQP